jgi:hypothetical protein
MMTIDHVISVGMSEALPCNKSSKLNHYNSLVFIGTQVNCYVPKRIPGRQISTKFWDVCPNYREIFVTEMSPLLSQLRICIRFPFWMSKKINRWTSVNNPLTHGLGRAIAQAVSRWLPTAAARVRAQVRSCGICGGQSGVGAGFLRVFQFPLPILIPPTSPHSSSIIWGWYNRPVSGRCTKWTQSHPTPRN